MAAGAAVGGRSVSAQERKTADRAKRRRADSYFGIHLDLHPKEADAALGRDVTDANIAEFLDQIRPDYVQYDCKGHAGWLGYVSKVSKSPKGIVKDSLALWRKLTAERNIALYIHFSGVWDSLAIEENPNWARIDAEGKPDTRQVSLWSPYLEERMIPQLLEVSEKYQLDGVWVDGDCWQTNADYSAKARLAWMQFGAGLEPPKKRGDTGWNAWAEMNRQQFRNYVRRYADVLHEKRPGFQIASNWLYSTFVPEKPDLPVDFLSGDYLGNAALPKARLEARYLAQTGKPWDLMAWGFQQANSNAVGSVHKPAIQLQQEASTVLAQGGGFQIYYQPTRAGYIDRRHIQTAAAVGEFAREREALAHRSETLSEVGVLFSRNDLYQTSGKLFGGWGNLTAPAAGLLDAFVAAHWSIDVQPDWAPIRYKTLVVPEWQQIGQRLSADIADQVRAGLNVLLCGVENARLFAPLLGGKVTGEAADGPAWIASDSLFANAKGKWTEFTHGQGEVLGYRYPAFDSTRDGVTAAVKVPAGAGSVVVIPGPVGTLYEATHAPALREFLDRCLRALAAPQVELPGSRAPLELVLRRKGNQTILHFFNYAGQQVAGNHAAHDYVPPLPGQRVRLRLSQEPKKLFWQPAGRALGWEWSGLPGGGGVVEFITPAIEIHAMAVFS
jgi:hypothetical protein